MDKERIVKKTFRVDIDNLLSLMKPVELAKEYQIQGNGVKFFYALLVSYKRERIIIQLKDISGI